MHDLRVLLNCRLGTCVDQSLAMYKVPVTCCYIHIHDLVLQSKTKVL